MCTAAAVELGELDSIRDAIGRVEAVRQPDDLAEARAARLAKAQRYGALRPV